VRRGTSCSRFARDGYARAGIDAIAAAAQVSTRTIYNHFADKAQLFQTVIEESAAQVAAAQIAIIDRHLSKVTDLEADLIEFALAWVTPMPDYAEHFCLVRQVNAEAGHIPQTAIDRWQEAGPLRVRRELAGRLERLSARGLLRVEDPDRAAHHFSVLVSGANPTYRGSVVPPEELADVVTSGVRAFLYGYGR
jgi:AcrR family transcriptional regulator